MDKEAVVHIYSGLFVSANEVDELRAYYAEWSKSEREKYRILMHIYGMYKDGPDEAICRAAMEIQT